MRSIFFLSETCIQPFPKRVFGNFLLTCCVWSRSRTIPFKKPECGRVHHAAPSLRRSCVRFMCDCRAGSCLVGVQGERCAVWTWVLWEEWLSVWFYLHFERQRLLSVYAYVCAVLETNGVFQQLKRLFSGACVKVCMCKTTNLPGFMYDWPVWQNVKTLILNSYLHLAFPFISLWDIWASFHSEQLQRCHLLFIVAKKPSFSVSLFSNLEFSPISYSTEMYSGLTYSGSMMNWM